MPACEYCQEIEDALAAERVAFDEVWEARLALEDAEVRLEDAQHRVVRARRFFTGSASALPAGQVVAT